MNIQPNSHEVRDFGKSMIARNPTMNPPSKFKAVGHDRQLQDLQYSGAEVEIITTAGVVYFGKILKRDRYTITTERHDGKQQIMFKSAIECIQFDKSAIQ